MLNKLLAVFALALAVLFSFAYGTLDEGTSLRLDFREPVTGIVVDPHRDRIAVLRDYKGISEWNAARGGVTVYDVKDRAFVKVYEHNGREIEAASFTDGGETLVFCERDELVRVDLGTGRELWRQKYRATPIQSMAIASDGDEAIVVITDGNGPQLFKLDDGSYLGKRSHQGCWSVLAIRGGWISVGDDEVKKWSLSADEPVAVAQFEKREMLGKRRTILLGGELFCTSTSEAPVEVWAADAFERKTTSDYETSPWYWLVAGEDGGTVIIQSTTHGVVTVSAETGEVLSTAAPLDIKEIGAIGDRLVDGCIVAAGHNGKRKWRLHLVPID